MEAVLQTVYILGMSGRVSRAADDDEVEVDGGPAASCTEFQVACRLRYACHVSERGETEGVLDPCL